jgi:hypothetical protein
MIPQCPACHQKTALAGNTAYCPSCGWNRDVAIFSVQKGLNSLPIAILMFAGFAAFLYWGLRLNRAPMLIIFPCIPGLAIPLNFLLLRRTLAKLKAMPAAAENSSVPSNDSAVVDHAPAATQTFSASARDEALLRTPPPRRIRVSKAGRITMGVVVIGLLTFLVPTTAGIHRQWALYHSFTGVRGLGWAIAIEAFVALAAFGIWRGQARECDLLEHGEAVMGRVLRQWTDSKNNSWIEYEFTDFAGSPHKGSCFDRTRQLFAGMPAVVFYDREKPSRQIAACTTLHEVILPSYSAPTASLAQELIGKR